MSHEINCPFPYEPCGCGDKASTPSPEELARECWKIAVRDYIGDEGASQIDSLDEVAISQIAALLRSRMERAERWIPVSEGLPKPKERVLIRFLEYDPDLRQKINVTRFGEIVNGHWRPEGGNGNFDDRVTSWRPLPSAPDTEKKA